MANFAQRSRIGEEWELMALRSMLNKK